MAPALGAILLCALTASAPARALAQDAETPATSDAPAAPVVETAQATETPPAAEAEPVADVAPIAEPASVLAMELAAWVRATGDNRQQPFIIIDKVTAEVVVFDGQGDLRGATPALLGLARGDTSVPGIGDRELAHIKPEERTTPAGRYAASFGYAPGQTNVFWVDYATAVSLHPVVTANRKEQRLQRLASPTPDDNRITFGCINVAKAFYDDVVVGTFNYKPGVVYILPEAGRPEDVFASFQSRVAAADASQTVAEAETPEDASPTAVAALAAVDPAQVESRVDASHVAPAEALPGADEAVVTAPQP